ncbi:MAG: hypothetical protein H0T54_00995 [Geodermatophilaceae bacterium]|nr:hypothetical protein [Geodermatophilaceae bacterium]
MAKPVQSSPSEDRSSEPPALNGAARPRARKQLLLGIVPVAVIAAVLLSALGASLPEARAPLNGATETATAQVLRNGVNPDGRGVEVSFTDADGNEQSGVIVLARPEDVSEGAAVGIQYDPFDPRVVYAEGDAAHLTVRNLLFGMFWIGLVLLICIGITVFRLVFRPRLLRRPTTTVSARRVRVRRGLSDRSWLVLDHGGSVSWVPVYWEEAVSSLHKETPIILHGNPRRDRLVMPVIDGRPIWPSGGRRRSAPKGQPSQPAPQNPAPRRGLLRQARSDAAALLFAPLFGLLWAYTDDSGVSGFLVATAVSVGVLFWLPSIFGSDPTGPRDDD